MTRTRPIKAWSNFERYAPANLRSVTINLWQQQRWAELRLYLLGALDAVSDRPALHEEIITLRSIVKAHDAVRTSIRHVDAGVYQISNETGDCNGRGNL